MFCQNCGSNVDNNTNFCPYCGKNLNYNNNTNNSSSNCNIEANNASSMDQIMGILSLVLTFVLPPIGFVLGIVGLCIVQDVKYKQMCKISVIIQVVIIVICVVLFLILFMLMLSSPNVLFPYGL